MAKVTICIIDKLSPPSVPPKNLADAMTSSDANERARAWNAEVVRYTDDLKTWNLEEPLKDYRPLPYVMTFCSKTKEYGRLEKHNVRCATRGDIMRPGLDYDGTRTASHMTS